MKLYSYCLRFDDGAAPNPFWGVCTLVICKPAIRRKAETGDWIVGLGSANSPLGDTSNCVLYAMKVTNKMTMWEYDDYCRANLKNKIPQWRNRTDKRLRVGDCIYDYSEGEPPKIRWSVHNEESRKRDLGGKHALLSNHFYYFGNAAIALPQKLYPIIHATQGHKSGSNQPYILEFISWIEGLKLKPNKLYGQPQLWEIDVVNDENEDEFRSKCVKRHSETDDEFELGEKC